MEFKGFDNSYLTKFSGNIGLCYSENQTYSLFTACCSLIVWRKYVVDVVKPACILIIVLESINQFLLSTVRYPLKSGGLDLFAFSYCGLIVRTE
jgi:hypothetical protein